MQSRWGRVNGPITAVLATAKRITWNFIDPFILQNDIGATFDCRVDSPKAIANAVKDGVRRWWCSAERLKMRSREAYSLALRPRSPCSCLC